MDVTDAAQLSRAVKLLARRCRVMRGAYQRVGVPTWRTRPAGYSGLARIVAFQQVSTLAAAAIWARVETLLGKVTPASVLAADIDALRAAGLSRPKIAHLRSIAEAAQSGDLSFRRIAKAGDDDARSELIAVKGVGPWTADVYLMCCLRRCDVFPHADIGLSQAYRMISGEETRQTPKRFLETGDAWRPWRGVAAHLLWAYINDVRNAQRGGA